MAPTTCSKTNKQADKVRLGKDGTFRHEVSEDPRPAALRKESLDTTRARDIPIYKIDQSLAPAARYVELATDFAPQLHSVSSIFADLVHEVNPRLSLGLVSSAARLSLRRLPSHEQTAELLGISKAAGVDMYLLICFNTLLDSFMGCTSGGVRVHDSANQKRMLHFRTLDWGVSTRQIHCRWGCCLHD